VLAPTPYRPVKPYEGRCIHGAEPAAVDGAFQFGNRRIHRTGSAHACLHCRALRGLIAFMAEGVLNMGKTRYDWFGKGSAGVLCGLGLAVAVSGLFAWLGPGGLYAPNKFQLNMWLMSPIWLGVISFCFLFRSGLRAWLWLGGANALAFVGLYACRHFLS